MFWWVLRYSAGWPGTACVDQSDPELGVLLPVFLPAGTVACAATASRVSVFWIW